MDRQTGRWCYDAVYNNINNDQQVKGPQRERHRAREVASLGADSEKQEVQKKK